MKRTIIDIALMLSIPLLHTCYGLLNNSNRGAHLLVTALDEMVPFVEGFIIPYVVWYPYVFVVLFLLCIKDRKVYYKILISLNIGFVCSYITFYFFQSTVPRPEVLGNDIFSEMVRIIYNHDEPFNCLPSIHVLSTYYMMRGISISNIKNKIITYSTHITGVFIILSTQFIKQHVLLDIIAAIVLGEVTIIIVNLLSKKFSNKYCNIFSS